MSAFIIAEAGLNHAGSMKKAKMLCDAAKWAGADAVKFQATDIESTWSRNTKEYEALTDDQTYSRIKEAELKKDEILELKFYCDEIGIEFMATPSTVEILDFLMLTGMKIIKIGSDRVDENDLMNSALWYSEERDIPLLYSNGLSKLDRGNMLCVSKYPAKLADYDFKLLSDMIGLSDHTLEHSIEIAAVIASMRVKYYEKHIKIDNHCIDAATSLNVYQFKRLVHEIRKAEERFQ